MPDSEQGFQHLQLNQLHDVLGQNSHTIVDIRDPASFQSGHIAGAIHLTNDTIGDFLRAADLDAPVEGCCYHGIDSQQAAQFLVSQDFTDVYSLDGGFTAWQLNYPNDVER